jgi:hypothetical protein
VARPPSPPEVDPAWVSFYDPARSAGGYNLILYRRRVPALIDMTGSLVHSWPAVRASARAQLQPDGRLAVITDEGDFAEYDWEGRQTMSFSPVRRRFLHHDLTRLRNGDYLLLVHALGDPGFDYLLEIDRSGHEVWRWESHGHLDEDLRNSRPPARQPHMNSVQELPPNAWFDRGHQEFRPGNILVSARHLNAVYIVARPGGNIVWRHTRGLDYQHEARMVPPGSPAAGHILIFDNGYNNFERFRRSAILELDPIGHSVVWRYDAPHFFTSTAGTEQALPNGNVLVTSSESGRAFEVTRKGRIVWQWTPSYPPMRVARYAYDFCPQLAARRRPVEKPVRRADPGAFIDAELYRFALDNEVEKVGQRRNKVTVLVNKNSCQTLLLPRGAQLTLGYGIDRDAFASAVQARRALFTATLRVVGEKEKQQLLDMIVDADRFPEETRRGPIALRHRTLSLEQFGGKRVELCVTLADNEGTSGSAGFYWEPPYVSGGPSTPGEGLEEPKTEGAERLQEEQLKALGYVE